MKKILLTLAIMAFPLATQAKDQQKYMPPELVDQAVELFAPEFCPPNSKGGGVRGIVGPIAECYQHTPIESPIMDICLLVDSTVMSSVKVEREESLARGDSRPYREIPFLEIDAYVERFSKMTAISPRYEHVGNLHIYFDKAMDLFSEKMTQECQKPKYQAIP